MAIALPAAAPATPAAAPATGGSEVVAPLSGSIVEVLVAVGDTVSDGDPVFVIEAMKMETEIRASASGSVQSIAVKKGDAIQAEQSLMVIG